MDETAPRKLNFRCSQGEKDRWEDLALERGLTLSSLIRLLLNEQLGVVDNSVENSDEVAEPRARPSAEKGSDDGLIPFSRTCRLAQHHWLLPDGETCPVCGGAPGRRR